MSRSSSTVTASEISREVPQPRLLEKKRNKCLPPTPPLRDNARVSDAAPSIADNPARQRYEIRVDGEGAGFLRYRLEPGQISLDHTEIEARFEDRGLGSELVSFALDDARERGLAVLPFCPFVTAYIQRHREYAGLVPEDRRAEFEL